MSFVVLSTRGIFFSGWAPASTQGGVGGLRSLDIHLPRSTHPLFSRTGGGCDPGAADDSGDPGAIRGRSGLRHDCGTALAQGALSLHVADGQRITNPLPVRLLTPVERWVRSVGGEARLSVVSLSRLWSIRTCSAGAMSWHAGLPSVPQCARVPTDCRSAPGRSRCCRARADRLRSRTISARRSGHVTLPPQQHASDSVVRTYPHAPGTDRRHVWSHARIAVAGSVRSPSVQDPC